MATNIHSSAVVHPGARLADEVTIGPFCLVEDGVEIEQGTVLEAQVTLHTGTRLGRHCRIGPGTVLGGAPQDHKYKGERSYLRIGDHNTLRECVTMHLAVGEEVATSIGEHNMFMAYSHVGHNCEIGSRNTIASYVGLSGHVIVADHVIIGGMVGVHQFSRIGKLAMIGGMSKINQNIPPFMMADGVPARVVELNRIGLRRYGIGPSVRSDLRQAYKLLYRSNLNFSQAMERIREEVEHSEELDHLVAFMMQGGFGGRGGEMPST
jgi:UDP-N-acetylglucosamine acyltransferase